MISNFQTCQVNNDLEMVCSPHERPVRWTYASRQFWRLDFCTPFHGAAHYVRADESVGRLMMRDFRMENSATSHFIEAFIQKSKKILYKMSCKAIFLYFEAVSGLEIPIY